ncbi:MAG: hypothetical protein SPH82_01530 [Eubacteriales bacterium]|nr:hypothetical protein [Eubacteriales bacterium]
MKTCGAADTSADAQWSNPAGASVYFTTKGNNAPSITVSSNAPLGYTVTYTLSWGNGGSGGGRPGSGGGSSATLTFIVSDHNEIIKQSIAGYPVILSILDYSQNSSAYGTMPAEPGLTLDVNYRHIYQNGNNYAVKDGRTTFSNTATGIISESIVDALVTSTDGSSTVGIYDADGSDCMAYISGIEWDKVLTVLANLNAVKATDGTTLTTSNMSNYEVIPYVIKLMSATDVGWHIDCVVKPKSDITLSYDLNLKNYIAPGITLPSTSVGKSPLTATVGSIEGLTNNVIDATLNGEDYHLTFLGWSTDPNATTATYQPGGSITIEDDTVLYAVWKDEKAPGSLTIIKTVTGASDQSFIFNVTGTNGYSAQVVITGAGSVTLTGLQPGAYTVTEDTDWSWRFSLQSGTSIQQTVTISGGGSAEVSFTNVKKTDQKWLDDESSCVNRFAEVSSDEE